MEASSAERALRWVSTFILCSTIVSVGNAQDLTAEFSLPDGLAHDRFGSTVVMEGNRVLIASVNRDEGPSMVDVGSVYIFDLIANSWTLSARLNALDATTESRFGSAMQLEGDTIVVGAPLASEAGIVTGAVYIFQLIADNWVQTQKLVGTTSGAQSRFGQSLALEGDRLVVGASGHSIAGLDAGSAFVFEKVNGSWVEKTTLQVSSQLAGDQFGFSVAMHGDLIAVSAPWSSNIVNGDGAVFLFQNTGSGWNQLTKIQSSTPMPHQIFGRALDMDANTLVVGSPSANSSAVFSGMVTVFGMEYGSWTELVELLPGPDSSHHRFGFSVSLEEDMIAVGAPFAGDGPFPRGEVVLFSRTGRSWIELGAVTSPDYTPYEGVGMSTMLSDGQLLIGSPLTSGWTVGLGRAMLWNLSDLPEVGTYCEGSGCPCGNEDPDAGCYNSTSLGARLWAEGSLATSHPNPRLFADQLPPGKMAMLWMGEPGPGTVFGDGLLCMGGNGNPGSTLRLPYPPQVTGPQGALDFDAEFITGILNNSPGSIYNFQVIYRDAAGPCNTYFNLSNALALGMGI